ncbi:MAG: glucosyl-3-phosphoglycerate synthase [Acidimicrobiales bacterium]
MIRSFDARDFPAGAVLAAKGDRRVSVCLPARDEEGTVGTVVSAIREQLMRDVPVVDELVVVDDGSRDATAAVAVAAGATVVTAGAVLAGHPGGPGKGQAMWRGVHATTGDVVAFCDADLLHFDPAFVLGTVGPLLASPELAFVKGFYERPLDGPPGEGGRVTELTARPLITLLHPTLSPLVQPLAGECAGRRDVLESVPFVGGYGVDLGLVIDVAARFGTTAMAQSDLGSRRHRNRNLAELSAQAVAVAQVALERAGWRDGVGLPWPAVLHRPDGVGVAVTMAELPPLRSAHPARRSA